MGTVKQKRRWHQFRLRTLLLVLTATCLPLGWLAYQQQLARIRKAAVAELEHKQVHVYQYEPTALGRILRGWPALDRLVRRSLGDDVVSSPSAVEAVAIDDA